MNYRLLVCDSIERLRYWETPALPVPRIQSQIVQFGAAGGIAGSWLLRVSAVEPVAPYC
jgi:hypothetical protein